MRRVLLTILAALLCAAPAAAQAQTPAPNGPSVINRSGAPADVERIIRAFTQKESEFRKALNEYGFRREAILQTIAWGGQISGEYLRVSRFVFDDSGNRYEKILKFPVPTLSEIQITAEDLEDFGGVQAFALESSKMHEYNFSYVGKEKIDELDTYVFDVTPKVLSDARRLAALRKSKTPERFFQGRIWVDDQDLQIVKARGKGVPETDKAKFPTFETYREQIDGKYWFPTYTYADDELNFKSGQTVHLRMRIRFTDFERLRGRVREVEQGEELKDKSDPDKPAPQPTPPAPKPKP
jgi:hypothetical protein